MHLNNIVTWYIMLLRFTSLTGTKTVQWAIAKPRVVVQPTGCRFDVYKCIIIL